MSAAFRDRASWTDAEVLKLAKLCHGQSNPDFAALETEFGRSASAIKTAFSRNGISNPSNKPRTCLRCDRTFWSEGSGNRKCKRCQHRRAHEMECA